MDPDVLPDAEEAGASAEQAPETLNAEAQTEGSQEQEEKEEEQKPELTPEQRELRRAERKISRLVRQREELRAQLNQGLQERPIERDNRTNSDDSETLTLTKAQLQEQIEREARRHAEQIAPKLQEQRAQEEHRSRVVATLAKELGQEKFDALAADLDDAVGGLLDERGAPKAAAEAIFEAEDPASLIQYLADPDNADEAERIGRMSPLQAGRAIGRIEAKLAAKPKAPPMSKAPPPLEAAKGSGVVKKSAPSSMADYMAWADKQYARR